MRVLLLGLAISFLMACSGSKYGGDTLSQLKPEKMEVVEPQALDVSALDTIESYRKLTDFPADNPFRPKAMHRLADLLLDYGEEREVKLVDANKLEGDIGEYAESIQIYEDLLSTYPNYPATDEVLYQLARAYDKTSDLDRSDELLARLVNEFPHSQHIDEAQFRLGESYFLQGELAQAQQAYQAVLDQGQAGPFYEHVLLKNSWTLYKRDQLDTALESFFSLLALKFSAAKFDQLSGEPSNIGKADMEVVNDALRGMTLIFSLKNDAGELDKFSARYGSPRYNHLVYLRLAQLFHGGERFRDEGRIYQAYVTANPNTPYAAIFQLHLVDSFRHSRDYDHVIQAKQDFLNHLWHPETDRRNYGVKYDAHLSMFASAFLNDLSEYYHSRYQKNKHKNDYDAAVDWYQRYLSHFKSASNSIEKHFLLAELLYERNDYQAAGKEYEHVAYQYQMHGRAAEAGYSAILSYQKLLEGADDKNIDNWRRLQRASAVKFAKTFPEDSRVPNTVMVLANDDYERGEMEAAKQLLEALLDGTQTLDKTISYSAWLMLGHITYQAEDYLRAEHAYQSARKFVVAYTPQAFEAEEWQAASIYKQAEAVMQRGEIRAGVDMLLRIPLVAPNSSVVAQAKFDAAAELISLEEWQQATNLLEQFQGTYPDHKLQSEVPTKLAFVYMKQGRTLDAAYAYEQIAIHNKDREVQQEALLQAAQLYHEAENYTKATQTYKHYLNRYPDLDLQTFEVRQRLADIYAQQGQLNSRDHWLKDIIKQAKSSGFKQNDAVQYMASTAAFTLAERSYAEFESIELVEPIRERLAQKRRKMEVALSAYEQVGSYGYADYVSASTHRVGEIYYHLSQALFNSERPDNLDDEEMEQYEIMLEEQAYPFEEKAIDILESNIVRIRDGVYNNWIDESISTLAELLPAQYAKREEPSEVIDALH